MIKRILDFNGVPLECPDGVNFDESVRSEYTVKAHSNVGEDDDGNGMVFKGKAASSQEEYDGADDCKLDGDDDSEGKQEEQDGISPPPLEEHASFEYAVKVSNSFSVLEDNGKEPGSAVHFNEVLQANRDLYYKQGKAKEDRNSEWRLANDVVVGVIHDESEQDVFGEEAFKDIPPFPKLSEDGAEKQDIRGVGDLIERLSDKELEDIAAGSGIGVQVFREWVKNRFQGG